MRLFYIGLSIFFFFPLLCKEIVSMSCHEFLKERRGLLCRLLQDLDALLAPGSGTRAKIVVLKNVMIIQ